MSEAPLQSHWRKGRWTLGRVSTSSVETCRLVSPNGGREERRGGRRGRAETEIVGGELVFTSMHLNLYTHAARAQEFNGFSLVLWCFYYTHIASSPHLTWL